MQKHVRTCKNHVFFRTLLHQKSTHCVHPWTRWLRNWWVSTCFSSKNHHKWLNLNLGKAMKQAAGLWDEKTIQAEFHHPTWPWKAMESHGIMWKPWWPRVVQVVFSVHLEIWQNREKCHLATRWWSVIMIGCHFFYFFAEIILKKNMEMILCSIPVLRDEGGTCQPSVSPFLLLGVKLPFSCTKSSMGIAISNTFGGCELNDSSLWWNSKTIQSRASCVGVSIYR